MSTILKALRRLEQEKSARSDRPLSEAVANTPPPAAAPRSLSLWLVGAFSLAAAFSVTVAVLWFLGSGDPAPPVETTASVQTPSAEKPTSLQKTRPARVRHANSQRAKARRTLAQPESAQQPDGALSPAALASDVKVLTRAPEAPPLDADSESPPPVQEIPGLEPLQAGRATLLRPRPGTPTSPLPADAARIPPLVAPAPQTLAAPAGTPDEPSAKSVPSAVEPPATRETAASAARPVVEPDSEVVVAVVPPKSLPSEPTVEAPEPKTVDPPRKVAVAPPPVPRSPMPDIYVARTVWHPIADRRIAVVEFGEGGETLELREGDVIGPLVVGEIEPTGVYFVHEGVEVRRRVGTR